MLGYWTIITRGQIVYTPKRRKYQGTNTSAVDTVAQILEHFIYCLSFAHAALIVYILVEIRLSGYGSEHNGMAVRIHAHDKYKFGKGNIDLELYDLTT